MEEDIDILNEFVEDYISCLYEVYKTSYADKVYRAIKNVLNELERLKTENLNITRELLNRTDKLNDSVPRQIIRSKIKNMMV